MVGLGITALMPDNRLWIQRARPVPPRAPKKTSLKAKRAQKALNKSRPPPKKSHKKQPPKTAPPPTPPVEEPVSGKRKRSQVVIYGNVTPTVQALKRGAGAAETPSKSSRSTRSSGRLNPDTPASATKPAPLPRGTRVSRRLHAGDDEWQQVPDDWLEAKGNGRDADEESELSALTDEEEHEAELKAALEGSTVRCVVV